MTLISVVGPLPVLFFSFTDRQFIAGVFVFADVGTSVCVLDAVCCVSLLKWEVFLLRLLNEMTVHAEMSFVVDCTRIYWFALQYLTVGISILLTILSLAKYFFVVFLLAIGYMWAKQDVLLYVPEPGKNQVHATTAAHLLLLPTNSFQTSILLHAAKNFVYFCAHGCSNAVLGSCHEIGPIAWQHAWPLTRRHVQRKQW